MSGVGLTHIPLTETVSVFDGPRGLHVLGIGERRGLDAFVEQFFVGVVPDGLYTTMDVVPERIDVARSSKSTGHTDQRDGLERHVRHTSSFD